MRCDNCARVQWAGLRGGARLGRAVTADARRRDRSELLRTGDARAALEMRARRSLARQRSVLVAVVARLQATTLGSDAKKSER